MRIETVNAAKAAYYIALKDMKAYYFKPPNISWGILFPLAFLLAFYIRNPSDFSAMLPGFLALSLLFATTSMEAITITFERMTGALERLMLYPVSTLTVISGKVAGGAFFGITVTAALFFGLFLIFELNVTGPVLFLASVIISSIAFAALGAFVSVSVRQVFEAQTLANLFRFPMIFLSGVFIPIHDLPPSVRPVAYLMPLTYSIDSIKASLGYEPEVLPPMASLAVLLIFIFILFMLSIWILKRRMS
ncbi:MAG: ABC transporter permease [Deltaproteobacteria bacterium]|nr:ABC transporter permease [Deltaproteobacteria bacterium]